MHKIKTTLKFSSSFRTLSLISTFILFQFVLPQNAKSQERIIDQVVAVIGSEVIFESDVQKQYMQAKVQGVKSQTGDLLCEVFENLLTQQLMINQAKIDSIEVTDAEVEMQLNQRLNYFVSQFGSEDKMVEYFNMSIPEIKEDNRDAIRNEMLKQRVESEITQNIKVTPSEIKQFLNNLPEDSIPLIPGEIEAQQIMMYPPHDEQSIFMVKEKLLELRQRVLNGESFATLAILYSEDPGSAYKGGELGYVNRGELDPIYANEAFNLKPGTVSKIVESSFGYHIIQLIDKQGDRINTRHILLKPKVTAQDEAKILAKLDSLSQLIRQDSVTFDKAARRYSQDENTRLNGGLLINPNMGNTKFQLSDFPTTEYYIIKDLEVGKISKPFKSYDEKGSPVYKIIYIKSKTAPHKATFEQDYNLLENLTAVSKRQQAFEDWVDIKMKDASISIIDSYKKCTFINKNWLLYAK